MPLEEYRKKRTFKQTPEPAGRTRRGRKTPIFVVQKHAATSLHYDFRLEIDGVLTSWAVPRGPSLNPLDKRLAIMTEDHPIEYADFEGVIPPGNYGAGAVMIWDRGRYELRGEGPAAGQLARGELKFALHGVKLRGEFVLVHTGARSNAPSRVRQWLLIKHRDEHTDPSWDMESPVLGRSVFSGRTLEEIAAAQTERAAGGLAS